MIKSFITIGIFILCSIIKISPTTGAFVAGEGFTPGSAGPDSSSFSNYEALYINPGTNYSASDSSDTFSGFIAMSNFMCNTGHFSIVGPFLSSSTAVTAFYLDGDLFCGPNCLIYAPQIITSNGTPRTIVLGNDMVWPASTTLVADGGGPSDLTIDGAGNTLTIGAGIQFTTSSSTLRLRNMKLVLANTNPFPTGSSLYLDNVELYLDPSLAGSTVALGAVTTKGNVSVYGFGQVVSGTITIAGNSRLLINPGVQLTISSFTGVTLSTACSTLHLNGCTLSISSGLHLTVGKLILENRVLIDNGTNTLAAAGFILGDGASATNNVALVLYGDAMPIIKGYFFHKAA